MKTTITLILSFIFIHNNSFTQNPKGSISGILKDSTRAFKDLASVYLENSNHGTMSDDSGKFKLSNIPLVDYIIVCSLIRCEIQTRKVKTSNLI